MKRGVPVLWVERVIRVNDVAAAHAIDVIPAAVIGAATYDGGSVYRFLEDGCGLELVGGQADVTAVSADRSLLASSTWSPVSRSSGSTRSSARPPTGQSSTRPSTTSRPS